MNPLLHLARRAVQAWAGFWFGEFPPFSQWALLRICTALMVIYTLFVRSFDLAPEIAGQVTSNPALVVRVDIIAWPFSIFHWFPGVTWLWSMHALAVVIATALLAGVLTPLMALLSLLFQLSYAHHNPAMVLGLDGLLMLSLAYLSLVTSGRVLGVFSRPLEQKAPLPDYLSYLGEQEAGKGPGLPWSGLVLRVFQLHVCLIYFQSGLAKLKTDWLAGAALWHPRLVETGVPYSLEVLQGHGYLTSLITYSLLLFELFYGVLIWIPSLRYWILATAAAVHLTVGIAWGLLPFNLMMLVLNIAFLRPRHVEAVMFRLRTLPIWERLAIPRGGL